MRLWSLHPKYLDRQGLLAVWREGLLARKVLEGKTRGYRNHPQLVRFREQKDPFLRSTPTFFTYKKRPRGEASVSQKRQEGLPRRRYFWQKASLLTSLSTLNRSSGKETLKGTGLSLRLRGLSPTRFSP